MFYYTLKWSRSAAIFSYFNTYLQGEVTISWQAQNSWSDPMPPKKSNYTHLKWTSQYSWPIQTNSYSKSQWAVPYLEIVFFWFSSHYYIKCLINIFCSILDCIGHVLLILVWVQKYSVCSAVPFKSWFGFRSCPQWNNNIRIWSRAKSRYC